MLRYYLNLRTFFIPGFRFLCSYVCYFVLCALISCPPGVYRWTLSFELACIMHTAVLNTDPTLALRKWSHAPWKPSIKSICVCAASAEFEYRRAALVLSIRPSLQISLIRDVLCSNSTLVQLFSTYTGTGSNAWSTRGLHWRLLPQRCPFCRNYSVWGLWFVANAFLLLLQHSQEHQSLWV